MQEKVKEKIKLCREYRRKINLLDKLFRKGVLTKEDYNKSLKGKSYKEWVKYYNNRISYYKNILRETSLKKVYNYKLIIPLMVILFGLGIFLLFKSTWLVRTGPLFTGFAVYENNTLLEYIFGIQIFSTLFDLSTVPANISIQGKLPGDYLGYSVASGDINKDGINDTIIGAYGADPPSGANAGKVYVMYGSDNYTTGSVFNINLTSVSANITVYGNDSYDNLGWSVASGDINKDGIDDIIIGAIGADPGGAADGSNQGRGAAGKTYVIYGSNNYTFNKTFDLNLNTVLANITIYGRDKFDWSGYSVASGDINNDNFDDIIIGAYKANGTYEDLNDSGETYVIYGSSYTTRKIFDLKYDVWANITVFGENAYDYSGSSVTSSDVNNDGIDDIIIGAYGADAPNSNDAGKTYVIYGNSSYSHNKTFDLNVVSANLTIYGKDYLDFSGYAIASGDVNNDTIADIIIGAYGGNSTTEDLNDTGETYVIYGSNSYSFNKTFDLSIVSANITIYGNDSGDRLGASVASGDINNDGASDIIIGAYGADPSGGTDAGETYVIYGSNSYTTGKIFNLSTDSANITIYGNNTNDYTGAAVSSKDIKNNGIDDIIIGAYGADPSGGTDAGKTYVIHIISDHTPPYFANYTDNSSLTEPKINGYINLSLWINDNNALDLYLFSWNESGSWTNDSTWVSANNAISVQNWTERQVTNKHTDVGWQFWAIDIVGNINSSTIQTFTIRNTAPAIPTLVSPTNESISASLTIHLNISGSTDNDSDTLFFWYSINNTIYGSSQNYTYTASNDDYYNWSALSSDNITNSSWAPTYYFTVTQIIEEEEEKIPGVSYRGSTGEALPSKREFVIQPGLKIISDFPEDSALELIETNILFAGEDAKIIAQELSIANVPKINAYTFLEILDFNVFFDKATITFKVENKWILDDSIEEDSITLMLFNGDTWVPLTTEKVRTYQGYNYFKAETSTFGTFAITGSTKVFEPEPIEKELREITSEVTKELSTEKKVEVIKILSKIKDQKITYIVAISISLIGFFTLVLILHKRGYKRGRREEKRLKKIRKLILLGKFEKAEKLYKKVSEEQEDIEYYLTQYEIQKETKERESRELLEAAEKKIKQALENGHTKKQIIKAFLQKGWDKKVIKNLLKR